jgi:hypothetical protein
MGLLNNLMYPYFQKVNNIVTYETKELILSRVNRENFRQFPEGWNLNLPNKEDLPFWQKLRPDDIDVDVTIQVNWKDGGGLPIHADGYGNPTVDKTRHASATKRHCVITFPVSKYMSPTYFFEMEGHTPKNVCQCDYDAGNGAIINVVKKLHRIENPEEDRVVLQLNVPLGMNSTMKLWEEKLQYVKI